MIEKNQFVKVFFKNSICADGFVEHWTNQNAVLISMDGKSRFIIQNVSEDVIAVKIFLDIIKPKPKQHVEKQPETINQDDKYFKIKSLIELRKLQLEQEKKIISEKLKEHSPIYSKQIKYQNPFTG